MVKISVIIPIYNKVEYVGACIENILRQKFDGFEVVCVDDGSTDGSATICDQWAADDRRVRVVHTANGGVTAARRTGVELATGKYIVFVDADDGLLPRALATLYDAIERSGADEVIAPFRTMQGVASPVVYQGFVDTAPLIRDIVTSKNRFPVLWSIIFKRGLLAGVLDTPRDIVEGEDKLMQVKILMGRPRGFFIADYVYLYNLGLPNSRRHTLAREQCYDRLLRQTLAPRMEEFRTAYVLHQLKEYERFIHDGQFSVRHQYYRQAVTTLPPGIPLYDRLVFALPPLLAQPVIKLYRKLITLKQKGL